MRKLFTAISVGLVTSIFIMSGSALADPAQLVSGPTGTQVNGWYTEHPTVTVQAVCNGSPYGNTFSMDIAGWSWSGSGPTPEQAQPGKHYVELLSNDNSNMYINNDGTLSPYLAGGCSNPSGSSPTTVLWQGYIQWDTTSPTIGISSPSNNTNTASSTIQVTGSVSDTGSGVQSVTVNGTAASVSGSAYSITMPLVVGLNTFQATATSNSGQQTQSNSITVNRYENPASANSATPAIPTTTTGTGSTTPTKQTTTNNGTTPATGNAQNTPQATDNKSAPISTPVKVAAGAGGVGAAGLATASFLGYIPYKKIGLLASKLLLK